MGFSPTRLFSWKEIAAYLNVSVRTVQTWESLHGLPVHRIGNGPKARVFAEIPEIEAWLNGQKRRPRKK